MLRDLLVGACVTIPRLEQQSACEGQASASSARLPAGSTALCHLQDLRQALAQAVSAALGDHQSHGAGSPAHIPAAAGDALARKGQGRPQHYLGAQMQGQRVQSLQKVWTEWGGWRGW